MPRQNAVAKTGEILSFIHKFVSEHGYGPTYREIGDAVGIKAESTVFNATVRMLKDGLLTSAHSAHRNLRVTEKGLELAIQEEPIIIDDNDETVLKCKLNVPNGVTLPTGARPKKLILVFDNEDCGTEQVLYGEEVELLKPAK